MYKFPTRSLWPCLLVLCLLATSCGSAATPTPVPAEPVTLTLATIEVGGAWSAAETYAIEQFQSRQPHLSLERQGFSQAPQSYFTQTPPPDVMTSGAYAFVQQAIQQNLVQDLTELWAETELANAFPAGLQALSAYEGKQYYLPIGYAWTAIYYNRAVFDQYGLQPPSSWEELMVLCDTLLANGETPFSLSGRDSWLTLLWFDYLNLRLNGVEFHRALVQGQIPYTDSRVRAAVEVWSQLLRNGYVIERPESTDTFTSLTALVRADNGLLDGGKAVMTLISPFAMSGLPDNFQAELDFFPFPTLDPAIPVAEVVTTLGYMAPSRGAHLPETLTFLAYMGSQEGQTILAQQLGQSSTWVPARTDIDPELLSAPVQQGKAIVQDAPTLVSPYLLSLPMELWPQIDPALAAFLRNPDQIDTFLEQLEAARQQALDAGWLRES